MIAQFELLLTILIVATILAVLYGPWQKFWCYWLRQRMFEVRDEWFLLAAEGRIAFDDPNYRDVRDGINAMIFYAHRATWPRLVLRHFMTPPVPKEDRLFAAIDRIEDEDLRGLMRHRLNQIARKIAISILWRSPILSLGAPVWVPTILLIALLLGLLAAVVALIETLLLKVAEVLSRPLPDMMVASALIHAKSNAENYIKTQGQGQRYGPISAVALATACLVLHHVSWNATHDLPADQTMPGIAKTA